MFCAHNFAFFFRVTGLAALAFSTPLALAEPPATATRIPPPTVQLSPPSAPAVPKPKKKIDERAWDIGFLIREAMDPNSTFRGWDDLFSKEYNVNGTRVHVHERLSPNDPDQLSKLERTHELGAYDTEKLFLGARFREQYIRTELEKLQASDPYLRRIHKNTLEMLSDIENYLKQRPAPQRRRINETEAENILRSDRSTAYLFEDETQNRREIQSAKNQLMDSMDSNQQKGSQKRDPQESLKAIRERILQTRKDNYKIELESFVLDFPDTLQITDPESGKLRYLRLEDVNQAEIKGVKDNVWGGHRFEIRLGAHHPFSPVQRLAGGVGTHKTKNMGSIVDLYEARVEMFPNTERFNFGSTAQKAVLRAKLHPGYANSSVHNTTLFDKMDEAEVLKEVKTGRKRILEPNRTEIGNTLVLVPELFPHDDIRKETLNRLYWWGISQDPEFWKNKSAGKTGPHIFEAFAPDILDRNPYDVYDRSFGDVLGIQRDSSLAKKPKASMSFLGRFLNSRKKPTATGPVSYGQAGGNPSNTSKEQNEQSVTHRIEYTGPSGLDTKRLNVPQIEDFNLHSEIQTTTDIPGTLTIHSTQGEIAEGNKIRFPQPEGHDLVGLELRDSNGSILIEGIDYKLLKSDANDLVVVELSKKADLKTFQLQSSYTKSAAQSDNSELPQIDRKTLLRLSDELKKAGFSTLGAKLDEYYKTLMRSQRNASIERIEGIFKDSALYSYETEKKLVSGKGVFAKFSKFINADGVMCAQCDGTNALFRTFMNEAFKGSQDVEFKEANLFQIEPGQYFVNRSNYHAVTEMYVNGKKLRVFDATPPSLESPEEQKPRSSAQKTKAENNKHDKKSTQNLLKERVAKMKLHQRGLGDKLRNSPLPESIKLEKSQPHMKLAALSRLMAEHISGEAKLGWTLSEMKSNFPSTEKWLNEENLHIAFEKAFEDIGSKFKDFEKLTADPTKTAGASYRDIGIASATRHLYRKLEATIVAYKNFHSVKELDCNSLLKAASNAR